MKFRIKRPVLEGEIVPVNESDIAQIVAQSGQQSLDVFDKVASGGDFLPRLQLMGSNSELVKEGKIMQGKYALVMTKDSFTDLGVPVDALVLSWRPKAMEITADGEINTFYDKDAPEFAAIEQKSDVPDSGCMYGPEFLVYVPSQKKFATFFMSSKTARREARNVMGFMGRPCTLRAVLIKGKKYTWHGPQVVTSSTPFELPAIEEIKKNVEAFLNPKSSDVEAIEPTTDTTRAR